MTTPSSRTDVVQLGQEVTFILQETHKRFANLNPTECLYVSSFLIHQLPEQTDLHNQLRPSFTVPSSSTTRSVHQPRALATAAMEDTLTSTATASTLATPASDELDPFDNDNDHDDDDDAADESACQRRDQPYRASTAGAYEDDDFYAVPGGVAQSALNLNLSSLANTRRGSYAGETVDTAASQRGPLSVWQQSAVLILQHAARLFRQYEEDAEEAEDGGRAGSVGCEGVRASLQHALEEAANQWAYGSGSQWQTPRAGVSTAAAAMVASTPRAGLGAATAQSTAAPPVGGDMGMNSHHRQDAPALDGHVDMALMVMRAAEQQARMLCRQAYEDLYERHVVDTRRPPSQPARGNSHASGIPVPAPPVCSIVVECDAPDKGASSTGSSPRSPPHAPSPYHSEAETALLAFVVGCDLAQLEYLQQTVLACACDPYPGSDLTSADHDAMDAAAHRALCDRQRAWRQRHCLIRILEPSSTPSASESAAASVTDGGEETATEPTGLTYTLSEGFFALRSLLGLAFDVWGETDPHMVVLVDDPERSQTPAHIVPSTVFWSAWPNSVPLRPRRGEQRASLRGGPQMPFPLLPGNVLADDDDADDGGDELFDREEEDGEAEL